MIIVLYMDQEFYSISETARLLRVSFDTLRRWDKSGYLKSFRLTSRSHRLYRKHDIDHLLGKDDPILLGRSWVLGDPQIPPEQWYCSTRDVYQSRLESLRILLEKESGLNDIIPIVIAVAGEIGNNSFDHNLGNWPDVGGVFFAYDLKNKQIILADRGLGILHTLHRVKPQLKTDMSALKTAFTEIISGRFPEVRGNGLKFVRMMITKSHLSLFFQSGNGEVFISYLSTDLHIKKAKNFVRGCLGIITF